MTDRCLESLRFVLGFDRGLPVYEVVSISKVWFILGHPVWNDSIPVEKSDINKKFHFISALDRIILGRFIQLTYFKVLATTECTE